DSLKREYKITGRLDRQIDPFCSKNVRDLTLILRIFISRDY
ncbi:MAG: hypothetical protein ACI9ES_002266, partial [Oceanospirillaceae bacterium]